MEKLGDLVNRLTAAVATKDAAMPLSGRLCESYRDLAGADAAAITVHYAEPTRVTICATNPVASRLEDLQDIVGEGPGHSAAASGQMEICVVPSSGSSRWAMFVEAAQDLVTSAVIHAIPMHPEQEVFGVITLFQSSAPSEPLALTRQEAQFLANVLGSALMQEGASTHSLDGPWGSRAPIHQATGMVVAQMKVSPDDALALLRARAYAQRSTLADIAAAVVERRLNFSTR